MADFRSLEAIRERMRAEMKGHQERMTAILKAGLEETKFIAKHQDVPNEGATVETIRALQDQYGDWHLTVGRRRQLKKWTQADGRSWKKLAATHRWMTCHSIPAWHKGHVIKDQWSRRDNGRTQNAIVE
jgi:hypothetical protein